MSKFVHMPMEQDLSGLLQVSEYIRRDQDQLFASLMKSHLSEDTIMSTGNNFFLTEVFKSICLHRSVKCASALLEGKAGQCVDPNLPLNGGLYLLHHAAQSLHGGLINLLLLHGADPNLHVNDDQAKVPLSFALDALCNHSCVTDWSCKKSIFKLFYIFCLQELFETLEVIKLLALRTEQVQAVGLRCVQQGELVKLCALLIVAWPKLVGPFADQGISSCPIGQCILQELQMVSDQEVKLASSKDSELAVLRERKDNLISAWKMLKILEMARDDIMDYRYYTKSIPNFEVPFFLSRILADMHEIPLTADDVYSDDVKCLMPKLAPTDKARLYRSLEKQICLGSTRGSTSEFRQKRCSLGASHSRPFHTSPDLICSIVKSAKSEPIRHAQVARPSLLLLSANTWALLASAAKRIPK